MEHRLNEENGLSSMSKTDDNLSNCDGPLLDKQGVSKDSASERENLKSTMEGIFSSSSIRRERWKRNSCDNTKNYSQINGKDTNHCLWIMTLILGIIGFCNLLLSMTIIIVLRVSQGMEALEVISDENLIKFYGNTDLDRVCLERGICEGYGDEPMELTGNNAGVSIDVRSRIHGQPRASIQISPNLTSISRIRSFQVKDPKTGNIYFSTDFPNFGLPDGVVKIDVNVAETRRIIAPMNESLILKSTKEILLNGAEGATLESKNIIWTANNDIFFESKNGDIIIDTKQGILMDIRNIPIIPTYLPNQEDVNNQYKVCICMPEGKLFRVPVKSGTSIRTNCAQISTVSGLNPCQ